MSQSNRPPNFDGIARIYRWMERVTFGRSLSNCRCRFLDELRDCRSALVLGDGDGRFTARLLKANPNVQVEAVDASKAMLRELGRNAGVLGNRVRMHQADARRWQPGNSHYDLIVSHFFLDCLTTDEVAALADGLRSCTSNQTKWVVSEFAIPKSWFGRLVAWPLVKVLYLSFGLLTGLRVGRLPRHHDALSSAGFILDQKSTTLGGLLVSEFWVLSGRNAATSVSKSQDCGEPAREIVPRGTIVIRDTYDQISRN